MKPLLIVKTVFSLYEKPEVCLTKRALDRAPFSVNNTLLNDSEPMLNNKRLRPVISK